MCIPRCEQRETGFEEFTIDELNETAEKIEMGKAPGMDGISLETVKSVVKC